MAFSLGMPRPESKFVLPDGTITRDWYLFIAALLQAVGGPSVVPGGGVAPIDNQKQFEEFAVSSPEALAALTGVDELRNEISSMRQSFNFSNEINELRNELETAKQYASSLVNGIDQILMQIADIPVSQPTWGSISCTPNTATGYGITSIDGIPIGGTTPSTGAFTSLTTTGNAGIGGSPTLGILDVKGRVAIMGTAGPALAASVANQVIFEGPGSPIASRAIFGDGTGWQFTFAKRSGSVTTDIVSISDAGAIKASGGFGCNGTTAQAAFASGGAAPAGGTGTAAGGWDTAAHRDAAITLLNNIRTALVNNGIMS